VISKADGMDYAPTGQAAAVCARGEFPVAAVGLDHGHIYGMCNGLREAGADIARVYDPDPAKVQAFLAAHPGCQAASGEEEILQDARVKLVASASIPDARCPLGLRVMEHGKDFFSDKPPLTTRTQLAAARQACARTGRKYAVYYSERIHVEAAVLAGRMIQDGRIGRVLQVIGIGPHRASPEKRPAWFFDRARYGGILVDIGCHQIEQFLFFSGARDARVVQSKTANYRFKQHPLFDDYGDATLIGDNGATHYFRVDWFTPDGLSTWGDGRSFILGTEGYIELRKYLDVSRNREGDHLFLVDREGEHYVSAAGTTGFPFFGELIRDCLERTEKAFSQQMFFRAIELAIDAQEQALRVE
jgi:predicted dehydrogenase